jgi:LacI family transcriptional regulator
MSQLSKQVGVDDRMRQIALLHAGAMTDVRGRAVLASVVDAASSWGLALVLARANDTAHAVDGQITALLADGMSGVIYASDGVASRPHGALVASARLGTGIVACTISIDERGAAVLAVRRLLDLGHRRIGYLDVEGIGAVERDRRLTVQDALAEVDLLRPGLWVVAQPTAAGGRFSAGELLDSAEPPTALICFDDRLAMGVYDAARERGLDVPTALSVLAFEQGDSMATDLRPQLTTVRLPVQEVGTCAVDRLMGGPLRPRRDCDSVRLPAQLVERGSLATPPPRGPKA